MGAEGSGVDDGVASVTQPLSKVYSTTQMCINHLMYVSKVYSIKKHWEIYLFIYLNIWMLVSAME